MREKKLLNQQADQSEQRKQDRQFLGTSQAAEENHLKETLAIVQDNLEKYGAQVKELRESIDDMQAHFHDDNPELINDLENAYTMYDFLSSTLARSERALKKPYFGRIDVREEGAGSEETYYIGRGGIFRDVIHPVVIDWRAPIANLYYENGLGSCSYQSPKKESIAVDLKLKRTYEIENGRLQNIFDTETIANDDILTKYLSKNKQAVLGEIVATIQKEQNEIIRKTPYYNCLVQGVAGSGKTTVAMHRISYILYNYSETFKPEDFYIVGSNRLLLNYITGVLPDLDVYGVRQMTMEQLFVRLLYEDWDKDKYQTKAADTDHGVNMVKGQLSWFKDLEAFCGRLERTVISRESVYLDPKRFVEGFEDGKAGIHDRTGGQKSDPRKMTLLMDGRGLDEYLAQYTGYSIQRKINLLNDKLNARLDDEFLGVKYTEAEKKAIRRAFRSHYGGSVWKRSIFAIYREFLHEQSARGMAVELPDRAFDVYDLAALAYLYKRVKETEEISEAHHMVIDEAQDFGMMVYAALKYCVKDCTYTIMGDVSQNIQFGYGLNDWEELKELYVKGGSSSFGILKKSYRNTVEISEFATHILHHGKFMVYPVEPIIRHGKEPTVREVKGREALLNEAAAVCRDWQSKGLETIAVICRNEADAKKTADELGKRIPVKENNLETAEFGSGIMVLPVNYTKGLEFDAVLILDPTRAEYPVDDGHAKLLYVAATRALHELCVLHTGDLTGLIADPVPAESVRVAGELDASVQPLGKRKEETGMSGGISRLRGKRAAGRTAGDQTGENQSTMGKPLSEMDEDDDRFELLRKKQRENTMTKPAEPAVTVKTPVRPVTGLPGVSPAGSWAAGEKRAMSAPVKTPSSGFGSMAPTECLRAMGHPKIDQSVRWIRKQEDGLYLHSNYGVLRISPVSSRCLRVTFARGTELPLESCGANPKELFKDWKYRESPGMFELKTEHLCIQLDKRKGNLCYMTADKRPLVSERELESRLMEKAVSGRQRARLYLNWPKNEAVYGMGKGTKADFMLNGAARCISHEGSSGRLPMVVSEKGYGIAVASGNPVYCCHIAGYGYQLIGENAGVADYYFLFGEQNKALMAEYERICKA